MKDQSNSGYAAADKFPGNEDSIYSQGANAASSSDENKIPEKLPYVFTYRRPQEWHYSSHAFWQIRLITLK